MNRDAANVEAGLSSFRMWELNTLNKQYNDRFLALQ